MSGKKVEQESEGIVTSVGSLGIDHEASNERSYWNNPELYSDVNRLHQDWREFQQEAANQSRRRIMMRTIVTAEVLEQTTVPIEAVIPVGDHFLIYIGQNVHQQIAQVLDTTLPQQTEILLPNGYRLDRAVSMSDVEQLIHLWHQFGWSQEGVEAFVQAGTTPIVVIRNMDQLVVGAMIAESLQFGELLLVELTEMAVASSEKGNGLASILIRELSAHSTEVFGLNSLAYGEYNITTGAHRAAARAGNLAGRNNAVEGILRDHVEIETGVGNDQLEGYQTQWLHNFLVMYHAQG